MNDLLKFLLTVLSDRTFEQIILDLDKTIERQKDTLTDESGAALIRYVNIMSEMLIFYFNNSLASNEVFTVAKKYLTIQTCEQQVTIDYNRNKLLLLIKK